MGSDLPPLPLLSPTMNGDYVFPDSQTYESSRKHRQISILERETKQLRELLQTESKRADEAEARTRETVDHLRAINEARAQALQEAKQATEELKLYKIQLETAQKDIFRAQDVLKEVDKQRLDAQKEAAELRSKNRKLVQEARVQRAREQGRLQGMREGLEKGRDLGLLEGRLLGYPAQQPPPREREIIHDDAPPSPSTGISSLVEYRPSQSRSEQSRPRPPSRTTSVAPSMTSRRSVDTQSHYQSHQSENPIPVPPPVSVSRQPSTQNVGQGSQATNHTTEFTRPVSIRNRAPSPVHSVPFIPPDNFIPHIDADNIIRLPPPHEFQRPSDPPPASLRESDADERFIRSRAGTTYRRSRRHSSPESDSTTLSQMDLVNDPDRNPGMRTPMSAIPEVSSSQTSPDPQSPRSERDLRRQPSFTESTRTHQSQRSVARPSEPADLRVPIYSRPRTTSGSTISMIPPPPAPHHQASQSTLGSSVPPISVHAPSSPSSTTTGPIPPQHTGSLSPNRQPAPLPAEPSNLPRSPPPPEQAQFPQPIVLNSGQLPPNFVPMTYTPASVHAQLQPADQDANTSGDGPPVIPDSALFGTDSSEDSEAASSLDTLTTPPHSQRDLDQYYRGAGSHAGGSQAPGTPRWGGSMVGGAAQAPLPPSTTPGTPRSVWRGTSTTGAAGVPLPPSTVAGTPWAGSSTVGPEDVSLPPSTAINTPRWGGSVVGNKTASVKSRSGSRNTKRNVS